MATLMTITQADGKTISRTLINVTSWSGGFFNYSGYSSPVSLYAGQPILLELAHCNIWGPGYAKVGPCLPVLAIVRLSYFITKSILTSSLSLTPARGLCTQPLAQVLQRPRGSTDQHLNLQVLAGPVRPNSHWSTKHHRLQYQRDHSQLELPC